MFSAVRIRIFSSAAAKYWIDLILLVLVRTATPQVLNFTLNFEQGDLRRVVRIFPQGKIVKDKSGGISIISGQKRVQAGAFKAIEATTVRRDQREVRDHR